MSDVRVAVIGGGLAGITAALDCADAGTAVTLFESRSQLGGATFSIERNGYRLDNGQHVALRCCTSYRALLRRLGVEHKLAMQPRLRIDVLAPGGRTAVLDRTALPAPLHLGAALLRYRHLTPVERARAAQAVLALRKLDPADSRLDDQTFGAWLRAHGQSARAIECLWNLITLPTLNIHAEDASLQLATFVFRTGLLDESDACDIGVPQVPLSQLHGEPAAAALAERGVEVLLKTRVERVDPAEGGFAVAAGDASAAFDRVIVAVPHTVAPSLLPDGIVDADALAQLGQSPIVNVHLHYDRRVLDRPFVAAVDSPLQWIFDRTASAGVDRGQLISISISGADREQDRSRDELVAESTRALAALLPQAGAAQLLDGTVTREPRATFRAGPGVSRRRPPAATALAGLALAGAWTDTGWPATMEGAVRSGHAAASAVLATPDAARRSTRRLDAAA
ncbi:MAG TPA: hydroxysqualene dehydroxylase HpnE [Gaiellaceae bacterium]|nr:hydroxysqualene dehydroxylase HpnE [Gaiellaceae bacterium]